MVDASVVFETLSVTVGVSGVVEAGTSSGMDVLPKMLVYKRLV